MVACGLALWAGALRADSLRDGEGALRAGRLDAALRAFEQAEREGDARGIAGVGQVWLRRGSLARADSAFRRAIERDPGVAVAWYGRGEILRREDRCREAIPLLEKATQLDRKFPEAQLALGNCLVAAGDFDRGVAVLERGTRGNKTWAPRFLVARGAAWMSRDSLRRAAVDFTRAREIAPGDPAVRKALGEFYVQRGTWALAIPELRAAVALDSSDAETHHALARALFFAEDYEQALVTYRALVARAPDYAPGLLGLGDLLFRAAAADPRRYAEARPPLEAYVRLAPGDAKGLSLLGRVRYRMGDRDSALALMEEAERRGDRSPELYTALGLAYADRRQWDRALAAFERGAPGPREEALVAQVYEVAGRIAQADSLYRLMLARDSTSANAAFAFQQRGKLRFRERNYEAAAPFLARATALDSTLGDSWFYRGLSLKELGRDSLALETMRHAALVDSAKADRHFWLGVLADGLKQRDEAEAAFRKSAALDSTGAISAKSYRQLGYYRLMERKWKAAIPLLERAAALDSLDALAWLWLAQGSQNAGDRAKAARAYRRVLSLEPANAAARKGLDAVGNGTRREPAEAASGAASMGGR